MDPNQLSRTMQLRRKSSVCDETEENFREGVLMLSADGVVVQRYFTVYDHKISYSSRGREKSHEFSPLTRAILLDEQSRLSYYPFIVETDGQRPFMLAAENHEDAVDWIRAIQQEISRLILSILEVYEVKGFGDFLSATQGGEINEGRYAGYVLRKQGQQVVPLFMFLNDGKLSIKREAKLKEMVGSFKIGPKTSVEILLSFAGAAFSLDKEILIVSSEAARSNWIVALRSAIAKVSQVKAGKNDEIDFGAPQRATIRSNLLGNDLAAGPSGTMNVKDDADDHNVFYKTFAGSVRISGTVRLPDHTPTPPAIDLNTFRVVDDDLDDELDQAKFINMRLEFEDDDDNHSDMVSTASIVVDGESPSDSGISTSPLPFSPQASLMPAKQDMSMSQENIHSAAVSDLIKNNTSHKRAESLDTALKTGQGQTAQFPIGLHPVPSKSSHDKSRKNIKRIRLTSKYPEGPIRVYGGVLRTDEQYKTLIVSSDTTSSDVISIMLAKYDKNENEDDFVLVEEEVLNPINSRVLDPHESPLIAKLNWDSRRMQFAIRKRSEIKTMEDPKNFFRVRCMDGSRTSFRFNENLVSSRVCELIGEKVGLGKGYHIYFSLWISSDPLELQLEPHQQIKVVSEDWAIYLKKYVPVHENNLTFEITFRRWAFLSLTAERRIKDPVAVYLLSEQAMHAVQSGLYVYNEEDAAQLSALRCQLMLGDYNPEIHVPGHLLKHTNDFRDFLAPFITSTTRKEEFEAKVYKIYAAHRSKSQYIINLLFLQYVRQWPFYGATFFDATMISTHLKGSKRRHFLDETKLKGQVVRVAVNIEGIHLIDPQKLTILMTTTMDGVTINKDIDHPSAFFFEVEKIVSKGTLQRRDHETTVLYGLYSPQAPLIESFVGGVLNQRDEDARALRILRNLQRHQTDIPIDARFLHRHSLQIP